jgi:D-beta-D-heptose 7-phosphate kinase/D-beta-D-heptose 1-phosphate adenosyltransferase
VKRLNVLLYGDDCIDVYQYGNVTRINPEAPVPIFDFVREETKRGMSSNVAENLNKLGCNIKHITGNVASIKTRLIDERSGQQLLRIDENNISEPIKVSKETIREYNPDCIIISDYDKGSLDYETIRRIISYYQGPIFIDTKKTDIERFDHIWPQREVYVKINEQESKALESQHRNLIVTKGKEGALYKGVLHPAPIVEVSDVCGAGDTFLAALAYYHTINKNIEAAIKYANYAASITVKHLGVYAPSLEEIDHAIIG